MNDKISAIVVNLNSVVNRLEWIREQNYNDPDAVDLMGDVAEWVYEIDEAVEAIEKNITPDLSLSPKAREDSNTPLRPLSRGEL